MRSSDGAWDVRCPAELGRLFPRRSGYYFRVDASTAAQVLRILSQAYEIPAPALDRIPTGSRQHALYDYELETIFLRSRNHLRTVFHEFYHHLDNMTDGAYNSDDCQGGSSSLAWQFGEKLWAKFTRTTTNAQGSEVHCEEETT